MDEYKFVIQYNSKSEIEDKDLLQLHKSYWTYIAENNFEYKPTIYYINGAIATVDTRCFLCEYDSRKTGGCKSCPASISHDGDICIGGLYSEWSAKNVV